ncbi:MOSC domain-containing protein [Anderseniella sp. Alg231-50]|uniref:MOSC domain-containing protein n=1 Tax=Anderseniella sp. Alg231-50 TaxID=1922226 RepID=UPI000D5582A4
MSGVSEPRGKILALFTGKIESRWPGKAPSAINKQLAEAALRLEENGFVDDRQADLKVHGGPEKAVHHYASEHMEFWRGMFPEQGDQFVPGCFGENISTTGLHEDNLCLGDILSLGTARVQVCQGRQPCWKLNEHTGIRAMAAQFQKTACTGWYYRVLKNGVVAAGDDMKLLDRSNPEWMLKRLITARFDPNLAVADALELSRLPALSANWRQAFEKKSQSGFTENTDSRLLGT